MLFFEPTWCYTRSSLQESKYKLSCDKRCEWKPGKSRKIQEEIEEVRRSIHPSKLNTINIDDTFSFFLLKIEGKREKK